MRSSPASQIGLVVVAFGVATGVALREDWSWVDLLFVGTLLSFLFLLARFVWGTVVRSRGARRHERQVVAVGAGEASRRAVDDERARLSTEIDRSVRRSLLVVRDLVATADAATDPRLALVEMQRESRSAMAELRRQLGLISAGPDIALTGEGAGSSGDDPAPSDAPVVGVGDLALTAALLALTLVEILAFPDQGGSWLTSGAMALTVLVHRVAPAPAALAGATVLLLGAVTDAHVGDGVFYPIVIGLLLWRLLESRPTAASLASAAVLYVCAIGTRFVHDPTNAPINIVLLSLVAAAALVVGRTRRSKAQAEERVLAHEAELGRAREVAAERTRREVARELHDVVSHAVSLVAVQAGAAELAWPRDPDATRAGLRAIDDTVSTALADLDAERRGAAPAPVWADVTCTVDRLRSAGLDVRVETSGRPPDHLMPTVHRLVQEALTNVLKHAPAATAYVTVSSDPGRTQVEVTDDGTGRAPAAVGYGLVGLEDRVTAVGGTLSAGPTAAGFAVRAVLPHASVRVGQEPAR